METTPVLTPAPASAPAASPAEATAPPPRRALTWLAAAGLFGAAFLAAEWADRPPAPTPAGAPATEFSEERARPVLQHLAGTIGRRVIGTPGRDAAAAYLVSTLRAIPGVEVRVQERAGPTPSPFGPGTVILAHTRNVLARIPGDSASAVLVSAHYDSPPESVGAGDNAVSTAAAVEMARALAAGPRPRHTVVFNFNDGEEAGLLGSSAVLGDPWLREVRTFVNLESAGPRGKAVLFQAGPGNAWLTEAYARSAPLPYGTVLGQDIFQSGVIPSDTDFRVYRDQGGLRGLDVALYQDGYAYHTALDRVERVQPGSMQHIGENSLALVRELAGGALPGNVGGPPSIYYDLLGRTMFAYSQGTARVLAGLALVLALAALVLALRRTPLTAGRAAAALGVAVLAATAATLLPVILGALVGELLGRPHGWFARPWLGWATFAALALAGFFLVHGLWERRSGRSRPAEETALAALAGATLYWALLLALLTAAGAGSAYLALWWTLAGAAGLALWTVLPRHRGAALAVAWLLPALLTLQVQILLLKLAAPLTGRIPAPIALDPVVALVVALPMAWVALAGAAALHRVGGFRRAAAVFGAAGVAGLVVLAASDPYTAGRPKRLSVQHMVTDTTSRVNVAGMDRPELGNALRGVRGEPFRPSSAGTWGRPAERAELPALPIRVTDLGAHRDGTRSVRVQLDRGEYQVATLRIPRERLAGWSLSGELPPLPGGMESYQVRATPPPAGGWDFTLRLRGSEPVEVDVRETFPGARTPALERVMRELPSWTTPYASAARMSTTRL